MKHNEKTTKAIHDSIAHHEKNLHDLETLEGEFERGFFRDGNGNSLLIGKKEISFHGDTCALCNLFDCCKIEGCPLDKIGLGCNEYDSLWKKIIKSESRPEAITATKGMIEALRGLVEEEFKVGDRVTRSGGVYKKDLATVVGFNEEKILIRYDENDSYKNINVSCGFLKVELQKLPPLSPHASLKARIDTITCNTSLGEVDEIAGYLLGKNDFVRLAIDPQITTYMNCGQISIVGHGNYLSKNMDFRGKIHQSFSFQSQFGKISALKQALTWLLEKSDLKPTCPECKGSKVCPHCEKGD